MTVETVLILHHGSAPYLRHCLALSKSHGNHTVLIGNAVECKSLCDELWSDDVPLNDYEKFLLSYRHMSTNSKEFELLCFKRFFLALAFAREKNIAHFWMIDSDVLLLENVGPTARILLQENYKASLTQQDTGKAYSWSASAHISFWTVEALAAFVAYLQVLYTTDRIEQLREKHQYHLSNGLPGGICDMTALYLWQKEYGGVFNNATAHLRGLPFYDHNINCDFNYADDRFRMVPLLDVKRVGHDGQRCVVTMRDGTACRIGSLHFQGGAKRYIDKFVTTKSISLGSYLAHVPSRLRAKLISLVRRIVPKPARSTG